MGNKYILLTLVIVFVRPAQSQVGRPSFQYISSDSVSTHASNRYKAHSALRYFFMGKNYRKTWEQPVTLPVFRLSSSPYKVIELGGGMQTKSLKLEDGDGKAWALRTIDKDVTGAMPNFLKGTLAQKLSQDQISASMPYASVIIGSLAEAANITAAQPVIYFVADDTALGSYRSIFANSICMLEERDPGFTETVTTDTVLRRIQESNTHLVDQKTLLRARLFDMLIADWDRHYDNWRWGLVDSNGLHYYHAIPRDRDWAFYYSGGLIPRLMSKVALRFLINFTPKPKHIKNFSRKAHIFDGIFLNSLSADDWRDAIHQLQKDLSDEAIESAVRQLPPAIYHLNGNSIAQKLKSRRDALERPTMKYYSFLAKEVQVDGTADDEIFSLLPSDAGFRLQIYRKNEKDSAQQKIYERIFFRSETYRLTINGLGGNDQFDIDKNVQTRIKLKLNGGNGNDSYNLNGDLPVDVYDNAAEKNNLVKKREARIHLR